MPKDWGSLVSQFTDVGKLVHLAARQDAFDVDRVRGELLRQMRRYYEAELTNQAQRVGCAGQTGRLSNGAILSALNEQARLAAESIANTYNYDLAVAVAHIRAEVPTANRHVYANRLKTWEAKRGEWKNPQIQQNLELTARTRAQQDFYQYNNNLGAATLQPRQAVCPVCQGWVNRGEVPLYVAMNNPGPWHPNCPHFWQTDPDRVAQSECRNLWMGQ